MRRAAVMHREAKETILLPFRALYRILSGEGIFLTDQPGRSAGVPGFMRGAASFGNLPGKISRKGTAGRQLKESLIFESAGEEDDVTGGEESGRHCRSKKQLACLPAGKNVH